ncbi:hypothetical protein AVEN_158716-1 [Araneus ventricosus]|uniref:Uncharacterized protein n=1 Tax=Araneus ventricosus TaxID=182803 RepID=A0A4Y2HVU4_ARAVE|nr:hypothetical protein AVEN_158716-1 [Araneus ventricosus]
MPIVTRKILSEERRGEYMTRLKKSTVWFFNKKITVGCKQQIQRLDMLRTKYLTAGIPLLNQQCYPKLLKQHLAKEDDVLQPVARHVPVTLYRLKSVEKAGLSKSISSFHGISRDDCTLRDWCCPS